MTAFTYNDVEFTVEPAQDRWNVTFRAGDGKTGTVGAGLFAGVPANEVEECARRLVRAIFPVGVRCVGPDVAHALTVGDLKIVPPDVAHPNFIYWERDSVWDPDTAR